MTPTQATVTPAEYDQGSSARCACGTMNYFLVSLNNVTFQWVCCNCGEWNFHPDYIALRKRFDAFKNSVKQSTADR